MNGAFLICAMAAVAVHGLGHLLFARACGVHLGRLRFSATGFRLVSERAFCSYRAEALTALGGPLFNLIGAGLARLLFPSATDDFVTLSLYWGVLNLAPVRGFDGARILSCLLCSSRRAFGAPQTVDRLIGLLSGCFLLLLWLIAAYLLLRRGSALSLYAFCLQLFRSLCEDEREEISFDFSSKREMSDDLWRFTEFFRK